MMKNDKINKMQKIDKKWLSLKGDKIEKNDKLSSSIEWLNGVNGQFGIIFIKKWDFGAKNEFCANHLTDKMCTMFPWASLQRIKLSCVLKWKLWKLGDDKGFNVHVKKILW